ncbi:MAG: hypothetical protein FWH43_04610, partial [Endomicrobia bacterium]|nr:hypothetical protein [Endomicrobiia bacterium]
YKMKKLTAILVSIIFITSQAFSNTLGFSSFVPPINNIGTSVAVNGKLEILAGNNVEQRGRSN